ncbi:MAG: ABC transporter permease [Candidatus Hodarchaeota archaeon]
MQMYYEKRLMIGKRFVISVVIAFVIAVIVISSENNLLILKDITKPGLLTNLLKHTIAYAVPIFLAALGGLYSERSGVINLALEGMMLSGAFTAVIITYWTENMIVGLLAGVLIGVVLGSLHAVICIHLKGDQIISGVAINILAFGITSFGYKLVLREGIRVESIPRITELLDLEDQFSSVPDNYDIIRMLGNILFDQSPLLYVTIALGLLGHYFLYNTLYGLRIRAVGEHPRAVDTAGASVYALRYACVIFSGAMAAIAGVYLSMGILPGTFSKQMSASRGFIAIAAYIFGNWNIPGTVIASIMFGFFEALQEFLKLKGIYLNIPMFLPGRGWKTFNILNEQIIDMIPYLLTVAVLARSIRKVHPPGAIGRPYEKE